MRHRVILCGLKWQTPHQPEAGTMLARLTRSREQGMDMTTATRPRFGHLRCVSFRLLAACVLLVELAGYCLALGGGRLDAAPPPAPPSYPPVKLRGYGVVAGTFTATKIDGQSAGTLRIDCQDPEKAKLVLAKYLSDLQLLPGVGNRAESGRGIAAARRDCCGLRGQGPGVRRRGTVRGDGLDPGRANRRRA